MGCKSQNIDFKIIHKNNIGVQTVNYFHTNNQEFARVYGDSVKNDSLSFLRVGNNLITTEFSFSEKLKKRIKVGSIKYVNYFTSVSEFIPTGNVFSINEVPIENLNFIKKDLEIEEISKLNCQYSKGFYSKCDFKLSAEDNLPYMPNNSTIISVKTKKNQNILQEIEIEAKYFEEDFIYKRKYFYKNEKIQKITTTITDKISKNYYEDMFLLEKL